MSARTLEALEADFGPAEASQTTLPTERAYIAPVGVSVADAGIVATVCADPVMGALHSGDISAYGGDHSAAEQAFVNALAPRCNFDRSQIERIWIASPLGQRIGKSPKTENRADYRNRTIEKACERSPGEAVNFEEWRERILRPNASRYQLLNSAAVAALASIEWALQGIFPTKGLGAIFGPVGSAKTFLALLLAERFATGEQFFGRRVKQRTVVYLALEGEGGFQRRIKVIEIKRGAPLPDTFRLVLQSFRLNVAQDVTDLAEAIKELGEGVVVFVDTVNRAAPDIDENSSKDMGLVIEGAKRLQSLTDGLVVLVHHVGKDASKGLRGHSSLIAALDGAIEIKRDKDARSWTVAKSKDGEDGGDHGFKLRPIYIGQDAHGELVGSCVVEPCEMEIRARNLNAPTGGNQKLVLDALRPLLCNAGAVGLALAVAIETAALGLVCEEKRRPERARAAIETLASKGILRVQDGQLWLA